MRITDLEYFIALSESHSLNEAAQKLYIAQPGLTRALKKLEEELGVVLFTRSASGIVLSEAGKKILPEARQMVETYYAWKLLRPQNNLKHLNIYAPVSFSDFLLPDIVRKFRKAHHDISISFSEEMNAEAFLGDNGEASIVLTLQRSDCESKTSKHKPDVISFKLCNGKYFCMASKKSILAQMPAVSIDFLKGMYFATLGFSEVERDYPMQDILSAIPKNRIIPIASPNSIIKTLLCDPETYTVGYEPIIHRYEPVCSGDLILVPIDDAQDFSVILSCPRKAYNQYPLMREFVNEIRKAYSDFLLQKE